MSLSTTATTLTGFSSIASIYRALPPGVSRDQRISEALKNSQIESVVTQVLKDFSESIKSIPMLRELQIKVTQKNTPPEGNEINPPSGFDLIKKAAGKFARGIIRTFDSSMTLEEVESNLLRGNFSILEDKFFDYPHKIYESFDLIEFHLKMGTVKFAEIVPMLSKAAEAIVSIDDFDDFGGGEPMPSGQGPYPSILSHFFVQIKDHIENNKSETLDISRLKSLISQDLHSIEAYEHKAKSLELLRMLAPDLLKKLLEDKNDDDSTLLHDSIVFAELLPLCLERFSLNELVSLFYYRNNLLNMPLNGLTNDSELLPSQKILLAAVLAKGLLSQKITRLKEIQKSPSREVITFSEMFTNPLKGIADFRNSISDLSSDDKNKALALYINIKQLPLKTLDLNFRSPEIVKHLTYVDLSNLSSEEADDILKNCKNVHTLILGDQPVQKLPDLSQCRYLDVSKCSSTELPELPLCEKLFFNKETLLPSLMRSNVILESKDVIVVPIKEKQLKSAPQMAITLIDNHITPGKKILFRPASNQEDLFNINDFTQHEMANLGKSLSEIEGPLEDLRSLVLRDRPPVADDRVPGYKALGKLMAYCELHNNSFQLPFSHTSLEAIKSYDPTKEEDWYLETYLNLTSHANMNTTSVAISDGGTPDWHMVSPSETKTPTEEAKLNQQLPEKVKESPLFQALHHVASARAKFLKGE